MGRRERGCQRRTSIFLCFLPSSGIGFPRWDRDSIFWWSPRFGGCPSTTWLFLVGFFPSFLLSLYQAGSFLHLSPLSFCSFSFLHSLSSLCLSGSPKISRRRGHVQPKPKKLPSPSGWPRHLTRGPKNDVSKNSHHCHPLLLSLYNDRWHTSSLFYFSSVGQLGFFISFSCQSGNPAAAAPTRQLAAAAGFALCSARGSCSSSCGDVDWVEGEKDGEKMGEKPGERRSIHTEKEDSRRAAMKRRRENKLPIRKSP